MIIRKLHDEKPPEPAATMDLFLDEHMDGIAIKGMDRYGRIWIIGVITEDGLMIKGLIPSDTGWPLWVNRGELMVDNVKEDHEKGIPEDWEAKGINQNNLKGHL